MLPTYYGFVSKVTSGGGPTLVTVTIDNTGNASTLTNYQVKLSVTYVVGMQADFSDLRFRDTDDTTPLSFWIESYTASTSAIVWIKVPSITGSSTKTIYMHYGDTSAAGGSNGYDTFLLFDDSVYSYPVLRRGAGGAWDDYRVVGGGIGLDTLTGIYHMYYLGEDDNTSAWKMGHATSTDLITWTKDAGNPIVSPSVAWEGSGFFSGVPLTDLEGNLTTYDGKYWITYACVANPRKNGLLYADSPDGPWTKYAGNPTFEGRNDGTSWDSYETVIFSLVEEGGTFYAFYQANSTAGGGYKVGYATSTDLVTWTRSASYILNNGESWESTDIQDCVIRKYGSTYYLFYTGGPQSTSTSQYNGYATASSITGTYTKYASNPITPQGISFPQVIKKGNAWFMIGDNHNTFDKTMYVTPDLTSKWNWKNPEGSPVISGGAFTLTGATTQRLESNQTFLYKAIRTRANWKGSNGSLKWLGFIDGNATPLALMRTPRSATNLVGYTSTGGGSTVEISASVTDSFNVYDLLWRSGRVDFAMNDGAPVNVTSEVPTTALPVALTNYEDATYNLLVDWVLVREYSNPEPTITIG